MSDNFISGTDLALQFPETAANIVLVAYTDDGDTQNAWDVLISAHGPERSADLVRQAARQPRFDGVDIETLLRSVQPPF